MNIKGLTLAALLAACFPAYASQTEQQPVETTSQSAQEETAQERVFVDFTQSMRPLKGKVVIGENLATLDLPDSLVFYKPKDAERILVEGWDNPPSDTRPLGMIHPAGLSPLTDSSWAIVIEYEKSGYVSDEDAADIDYDEMLKDMQKSTLENNSWRVENGYEPTYLMGWAAKPHYDAEGKKLYWAKHLRLGIEEPEDYLNYDVRILGRKGVLILSFIGEMDQLADIEKALPSVLAMTTFNEGNRYAEFDPDIDEVAAYGIGALIAGKLAAKTGLLAALLILLKKFWFVPALLIGGAFKWLFGKRKKGDLDKE